MQFLLVMNVDFNILDFYIWGYVKALVYTDAHQQTRISSKNFGRCRWHSTAPYVLEDDLTTSVIRHAEFCVRLAGGHPNNFFLSCFNIKQVTLTVILVSNQIDAQFLL